MRCELDERSPLLQMKRPSSLQAARWPWAQKQIHMCCDKHALSFLTLATVSVYSMCVHDGIWAREFTGNTRCALLISFRQSKGEMTIWEECQWLTWSIDFKTSNPRDGVTTPKPDCIMRGNRLCLTAMPEPPHAPHCMLTEGQPYTPNFKSAASGCEEQPRGRADFVRVYSIYIDG